MGCLKCGRDIEEGAVFCPSCLKTMAKYPVRPGTPVLLPTRERILPKKVPKRRTIPAEEQIKGLKRRTHIFGALWIVTLLALIALTAVGWRLLSNPRYRPGQNYTAITATTAPAITQETLETTGS